MPTGLTTKTCFVFDFAISNSYSAPPGNGERGAAGRGQGLQWVNGRLHEAKAARH